MEVLCLTGEVNIFMAVFITSVVVVLNCSSEASESTKSKKVLAKCSYMIERLLKLISSSSIIGMNDVTRNYLLEKVLSALGSSS